MKRLHSLPAIAAVWLFLGIGGCATGGLTPAPEANRVAGLEDAARSAADGVSVLVQAADWPGAVDIRQEVTPLKIRMENRSGAPLRVRYNEFVLIGNNGEAFAALPLSQIEGEVTVKSERYDRPGFYHRNFSAAPHYSPLYRGIEPLSGVFARDPFYYEAHHDYWTDVELPTPEMRRQVIPEGVLAHDGDLEGWLFFEKVADVDQVVFRADLVDAETSRKFAEVRIPFSVE